MTDNSDTLEYLRKVTAALQEAKQRLRKQDEERHEPIAIVSMACRFPGGVESPDQLWRLLDEGRDVITEVPASRWDVDAVFDPSPEAHGKTYARWGGFVGDVDRFDPTFFGINTIEAQSCDPQQRLLLETTWETLERAGLTPADLVASATGVFVGICGTEYQQELMRDYRALDSYTMLGTVHSTVVGRLSYWLGLQGPNFPIDTACSSSLVALHLACQALRDRACSMALAGGVNLLLSPWGYVYFSRIRALSPTGRCHTFSADADGYVRAEGCGMVLLKRLSDAQRAGDDILAVIRGSAVNHDGRSNGFTAPSGPAQEEVIRQALAQARVEAATVDVVECHGTGTPLGDPIEVQALAAVYGRGRPAERPLVLGSVKTNIGHTEGAAGIAGVIKAVLALRHARIPESLHSARPNPLIPWDDLPVRVAGEALAWDRGGHPRRAGVSSFGLSGTNAHLILEEAPAVVPAERLTPEASSYLLPLSAKSPEALEALARSYAEHLSVADDDARLSDLAYTASVRRAHYEHRLAVVGRTREEMAGALSVFAEGGAPASGARGQVPSGGRPRQVFVFSGQGAQWVGMGQRLLAEEPVFRAKLEECDALLGRHVSWSLLEELAAPEERSRLAETEVVQPALFAIQVGIAELLRSWGVTPDAVIGHSVGEVAAAHVAGVLSLAEAARLVSLRGRVMQKATGLGKMAWIALPADQAVKEIAGREAALALAAINDPGSVVLSGETTALEEVVEALSRRKVECRTLRVNYAFHSPQMDPLARELAGLLGRVEARRATIPLYSTVTGAAIDGEALGSAYWARNVRDPVQFARAMASALADGHHLYVEVGPHPVLAANISQCVSAQEGEGQVVFTLRRQGDDRVAMLDALGALYAHGAEVTWGALHASGARCVPLPTYPWQRERFWVERPRVSSAPRDARSAPAGEGQHPLLGAPFASSLHAEEHLWEQWSSVEALPYLDDHRVQGEVVVPGAAYVEMALAAGRAVYGAGALVLEEMSFERMLALPPGSGRFVQVALADEGRGRGTVTISSRSEQETEWTRQASGKLQLIAGAGGAAPTPASMSTSQIRERCATVVEASEHYAQMVERGLLYGACFQGVERLWIGEGEALGRVRLPEELSGDARAYGIHPALLDACFQVTAAFLPPHSAKGTLVPVAAARAQQLGRVPEQVWVHVRRAPQDGARSPAHPAFDVTVLDEDGRRCFEIGALRLALFAAGTSVGDPFDDCVYVVAWRKKERGVEPPRSGRAKEGAWLVVLDARGTGTALAEALRARGEACIEALPGARYERVNDRLWRVDPTKPAELERLLDDALGTQRVCRGVVHCASLDAVASEETSDETLLADLRRGSLAAVTIAQALLRRGSRDTPRLVLLTRGAQAAGPRPRPGSVAQAPLWGLGRTIALEHPELECIRIDLPVDPLPREADLLAGEILAGDGEDQIALREEGRFVARLVRSSLAPVETLAEDLEPASGRPFRLEIRLPGVLERLHLHEMERRPPGPDEVEIEVEAAGLNFLDVMKAMGIYPGLPPGPVALGSECSGRVVAVGEGVTGLSVGREVIAWTTGGFASHVTVPATFVVEKGALLSFEQAATLPAVFMTVYWALHHVARLARGERILIHSASGGTGLAAIQYARAVGAEIFATAGSEEKRAFLRSLGIEHVMDSRTLAFADEIMARTGGRGVDVVLNSLAGEALVKSMEVLAPYGRFLEIGKKDIYDNSRIGLLPFRRCLSYTAIDMAGMVTEKPELFATILREVMDRFADRTFAPLPVHVFGTSAAQDAFRLMAQAKHVGKIAVRMNDPDVLIAPREARRGDLAADGTYLITGGLGGLGLTLAGWMVSKGARHLLLVGRGAPTGAAREAIRAMEEAGAEVRVLRGDVSLAADVEQMLRGYLPSLRGVVHAAGVLDDRTLLEMGEEQFWAPILPKVLGAWNLHAATRGAPLDFFVMYSSASVLLGSPGQAAYAAGNAFLDVLAHARAAEGLPAMSIQWGPFTDVGLAASQGNRGQRLSSRGIESFTPEEGNELFSRLLQRPRVEVGLVRLSMRQWLETQTQASGMRFLTELENEKAGPRGTKVGSFRQVLDRATSAERTTLIEGHVVEQLGRVLRLDPSHVDRRAPFTSLGVDSLMAMELRNRLEASLGLRLSAALLFTYPNPAALAAYLLTATVPASSPEAAAMDDAIGGFDHQDGSVALELSEEEAVAMLDARLSDLEDYLK